MGERDRVFVVCSSFRTQRLEVSDSRPTRCDAGCDARPTDVPSHTKHLTKKAMLTHNEALASNAISRQKDVPH